MDPLHPLSPNSPTTTERNNNKSHESYNNNNNNNNNSSSDQQIHYTSYFDLKAHCEQLRLMDSNHNQPSSSSQSPPPPPPPPTLTHHHHLSHQLEQTTNLAKENDQKQLNLLRPLPSLIQKVPPPISSGTTATRIKFSRDVTYKQQYHPSDQTATTHPIQKTATSRSSSTHSIHQSNSPTTTSKSPLQHPISHPSNPHPPPPTASTSTQHSSNSFLISLSDHPHLIPSDPQLLFELHQNLNHPSLHQQHQPISPSHQPSPELDHHPINPLSSLILSLIRVLSLKLSQTELDLKTSQLEVNALRSLLVDSYSVGPGAIERCLVRSRVSDHPPSSSSTPNLKPLPQIHKPPWQIELHDPLFYNQNTSSSSLISSLHPSSSSTQLDLEDLREAMSDNSYFDPTCSSPRPSRSHLNTPALAHHILAATHISESPMPIQFDSSDLKKTYSSMSKLFNTNGALNGKFRKSAPVPPSLPTSSDHPNQDQPSTRNSTPQYPTPHKRNTSIGSNLSTISSPCHSSAVGPRQPNNAWAFYGWKWNKRNKMNGALATSLYGETDINQRADDECEYFENQNHTTATATITNTPTTTAGKLDPNHLPNPSANRTSRNSQSHQPSQSTPGPSSEPFSQQSYPKRIMTDANSATVLGGFFDSFTRRKRTEPSKPPHPKSPLQSFTTSHQAIGPSEEPSKVFPASMDVSSSLVTNRSSSLLLDSSCSISTQTTSNSSSFSADDLGAHRPVGLDDDSQQACLTLPLPALSSTAASNHLPSNYSPSESALSSAANSIFPSTHSGLDSTLGGLDITLDHSDGLPATSSSTANCPTHSLLPRPNLSSSTSSSDPSSIIRRPSLGQLKSLPDSFTSNPKGLPTLATYSDTIVQIDKAQPNVLLTTVLAGFPGSSTKIDSIAENSDGELNPKSSHVSSSSLSLSSSVTGPAASTAPTNDRNSSRLRSQMSHQNLSLRSSASSMIASTSQNKSKPQVKLTQPATTKSYLSTATGTIGKALSTYASSNLSNSTELEPNGTTLPNAAFDRLASVYSALPDSRAGIESPRLLSSNKSPFASIFPASQTSQGSSSAALGPDPNHLSAIESLSMTSVLSEPINHRGIDKLTLKFLPPLSNSTMELSTFTNPQSNPPPFSNSAGDEDSRGFRVLSGVSSGASNDEPIIDRFGFIVDAKYGMKLMQKSREKKKRLAKELLAALDEQASTSPQPPTSTGNSNKQEQQPLDSTALTTSLSASINSPSSTLMSNPRPAENNKFTSTRCDGSLESSDLEQTPMLTTALPIKSQVDVEAELTSLREALGLAAPNKPNEDPPTGSNESFDLPPSNRNITAQPEVESTTQSIRRLLSQLNEMQNMLEKKQMEAWGQFITKRRLKQLKASNSASLHNAVSSSGDPNSKSTIQGTGVVSPASVGAFLGTTGSGQSNGSQLTATSSTSRISSNSETPHSQQDSNHTGGHSYNQDINKKHNKQVRDSITCHDDNLIGIASMGLSNDNNKKALRDEWREFKNLVIDGIPIGLRPKIWLECSGASELKEPGYYHDLLNLHRGEEDLCLNQIECDVTRTLPTNVYFGGDGPGVGKLRRVLAAMSWHNPLVGYCQGMNMVAATLLLTIPSEEDAFWILACIVDKILPSHYYTSHLLTSQADQRVLKELVLIYLPQLAEHFDALDVELPAITISLALLKMNQSTIISHDSPASLYAYMRGPMTLTSHHADKLINVATVDFKHVKNKQILGLRDKFVTEIKSEMGLSDKI